MGDGVGRGHAKHACALRCAKLSWHCTRGGRSARGEEGGGGGDKGGEVGGESERRTWTRNASWLQLAVVEWRRQRVANRGGFMYSRAVALGLRRGNEA